MATDKLEYELSVWEDGRASIEFPHYIFKPEWFQATADQLQTLLGMTPVKTGPKGDRYFIEYDNGCVFTMDNWGCSIVFPTALKQYEVAIRLKTELRWIPQSRVYAWAPVTEEVEEVIEILHQTLAFLMYHSPDFDEEGQVILMESMSEIQEIVSLIRNGDDWTVEDIHSLYFDTAAAKPDNVPQSWADQFLTLAGKAGQALTSYQSSLKLQ